MSHLENVFKLKYFITFYSRTLFPVNYARY